MEQERGMDGNPTAPPMKEGPKGGDQAASGEVAHPPTGTVDDIVASRAVATERVFKGGTLAVLGFGGALLIDLLNFGSGLPFWISMGLTLTAFGAGSVWAGFGASHLIRHGRRGSFLWLASLAGLGGSVILEVVSGLLLTAWDSPVLWVLNQVAMASCGVFTLGLIVLGIITLVRWMLPGEDPGDPDGAPGTSSW